MSLAGKTRRAISMLAAPGGTGRSVARLLEKRREKSDYRRWLRKTSEAAPGERSMMAAEIESWEVKPLISVVMPVYDVAEQWLRAAIDSVRRQIYPQWELCVADDHSPSPHVRRVLDEYAAIDDRIRVVYRPENGHISAASNSALELATGEFAVLLDHDDELSEDALYWLVREIDRFPDAAMFYSDEDTIDEKGRRFFPRFKPDFSRDLFYSINLVTHLSAYRTELLRRVGGFRVGLEGSQDYDLALRVIEQIPEEAVRHIPRILYHWRALHTSAAHSADAKPYAYERAREALRSHFDRTGVEARVESTVLNLNRVRYKLPKRLPRVSIIASGPGDGAELESRLRGVTRYPDLEIIRSGNSPRASELNRATARASGEVLCFLDPSCEPEDADWLSELVSFAMQPGIGAVGPKLLDVEGFVLSAGTVIGQDGILAGAHEGIRRNEHGNFVRAALVGNYSALPPSGLTVRREVFDLAGGFDAENLENSLFAADLCLRLRQTKYRIVFTPYAGLICRGCLDSREPANEEAAFFARKWKDVIERDPHYNPNFSRRGRTFSLDL